LTPDRELLEEILKPGGDQVIVGFRTVKADGSAVGIKPEDIFRFADGDGGEFDDKELPDWVLEASQIFGIGGALEDSLSGHQEGLIAEAIAGGQNAGPAQPPEPTSLGVSPGGLIADAVSRARPLPSADGRWVFCERCVGLGPGDTVPDSMKRFSLGAKGIAEDEGGRSVFIRRSVLPAMRDTDSIDYSVAVRRASIAAERLDPRVMPIVRDINGGRYMDFRAVVDRTLSTIDPDHPLGGPVSGPWLLRFMLHHGGGPMPFHNRFMAEARLDYTAGGIGEHFAICKFLELITTYDMQDVSQSAGVEFLCRRLQTIHDRWKHKMPSQVAGNRQSGMDEDSMVLLGIQETAGACGVMPELAAWLGSEVGKKALADKERRKAREERALQAKEK